MMANTKKQIIGSEHIRPDWKYLITYVVPSVAPNWKVLSKMLLNHDLVKNGYLETIESNSPGKVKCCKRMFKKWLETDTSASWKKLIEALQSPDVQLNCVAENIQKMMLKDVDTRSRVEGAVIIHQVKDKSVVPTMKDINRYVTREHAADWKEIGIELGLKYATLTIIEKDNPLKCETCFQAMIDKWIKSSSENITWKVLEVALTNVNRQKLYLDSVDDVYDINHQKLQQAPVITSHPKNVLVQGGYPTILEVKAYGTAPLHYQWYRNSRQIIGKESFYCICSVTKSNAGRYHCEVKNQYGKNRSTFATVTVTYSAITKSRIQHDITPSTSKLKCKICSPKNSISDISVHNEGPSSSDYLLRSQLFSSNQESITQHCENYETIDSIFVTFVTKVCNTLKEEKEFITVRRNCFQNVNVTGTISLQKETQNEIRHAENFDKLFDVLCTTPYWNWMNIRMIEKMAGDCISARKLIIQYKNKIFSKKVKDILSEIPKFEVDTDTYTKVTEKWDKNFNDLTINDVVERWSDIEEKFDVEDKMLLKSITEGCVEICWLLSNDCVKHVVDLATNSQSVHKHDHQPDKDTQDMLHDMLYLKIGNAVIKDDFIIKDDITDEYLYIATDTLVKYYKSEDTVLLEYDWPTCCVEHYTPLTIFCYNENYTKSEATAVARMLTSTGIMTHEHHDNVYGKITENISELFPPIEKFTCSAYVIHIEGAAGIGKSTLCKEIALQWANKEILKNTRILFLLFMHDPKMKNLTNIELLVNHFIKSEILASKITKWLIETNGKYLTIIIDGYSKVCKNSFITNDIIGRKTLTQCGLVITSRSAASSHLSKIVNHKALVLGFSMGNHITFINTALKDSHSKINHFKDYLHFNPLIDNLCNIPLIMTVLLWYFVNDKEMSSLPNTQASIIQKYVAMITKKKLIPSFIHPYDQVMKDLSQFAFIAIQEGQLTFTKDEILKLCEKNFQVYWEGPDFLGRMFKIGLLNTISLQVENVDCQIFYFSNLKIQEYLAAYYISLLPDSEVLKLLHGTSVNIHYLNVWMLYVDISEGKNSVFECFLAGSQPSDVSVKADGNLDNKLPSIDLKHQKLSHNHLCMLAMLLSRSINKQLKHLNLASCGMDSQDCKVICEMLCLSTEFKFETVDISFNNFHWESFYTFCSMLKAWNTKNFVFTVDMLYDAVENTVINSFTAILEENFQNNVSSDSILLLAYVAKRNALIAVYVAPTRIRWSHWIDCNQNGDMIKHLKTFVKNKVSNDRFKLVFSYNLINNHNIKKISTLLGGIKNIQLCGSYLHSKGAYLLNIASTFDYQHNSPQELVADYLAAVLSHNFQSTMPYLESLPAAYATIVKNSLQYVLPSVFNISDNPITSNIATEIGIVLSLTRTLQEFNASGNNLSAQSMIIIATGLEKISTLKVFNINNNNAGEEAAAVIATVLSHNTQLQRLHLSDNNFETIGMNTIANALKSIRISTLTVLNISNNSIGEEAATAIATVLTHNTELQRLHLSNNNFTTTGMIKIAIALQNISTLKVLNINKNSIDKRAADDVAMILPHNTKLQKLHLNNNKFMTEGMIKITKALQNIKTLIVFNITNTNVDEDAADNIAAVLSHNTYLQELYLDNNNLKTVGMIKIAQALQNVSNLKKLSISNNCINEGAADDIATLLSCNTQLKMLDIHSNNLRETGAIIITEALRNTPTLEKYDISSNDIAEEAVHTLKNILSWNTKLKLHM